MKARISIKSLLTHSPLVVTGLWTIAVLAIWYWQWLGIGRWEFASFNLRCHWRGEFPSDHRIVLVAVDEGSVLGDSVDETDIKENPGYQYLIEYPYPRKAWALAIEKAVSLGARVVVFDFVLSKGSPLGEGKAGKADNEALKRVLIKYRDRVVLGANFTKSETGTDGMTTDPLTMPNSEILPSSIVPDSELVGYVNYQQDGDGFIRRMNPVGWPYSSLTNLTYSIDALAVKKAFPEIKLPALNQTQFIQFGGYRGVYQPIPFHLLFATKAWQPNTRYTIKPIFKDKIVLIGPRANIFQDEHLTPFGDGNPSKMPGVDIHAHAMATLMNGHFLHEVGQIHVVWPFAIIAAAGLVLAILLHLAKSPFGKLVPAFGFGVYYLYLAQFAFEGWDLFVPLIPVMSLIVGSTASVVALQAIVERLEKQRARGFLTRYVSRNVAEELLKRGKDVDEMLKPQRRFVTVLMSDVRNFTTMTESSEPEPFVHQLNEYLTDMVECVFNNNGTLDKFVGDAVMAVFGSPTSQGKTEDALAAVKTAVEMRQRLADLHVKWEKDGRPIFRFGIGVNAGEVMAGDIGSSQKAEFGVIGDAVNLAARVESATKEQKTDILITQSIYDLVQDHVEVELKGDIKVKGREQAVRIYALKGMKEDFKN